MMVLLLNLIGHVVLLKNASFGHERKRSKITSLRGVATGSQGSSIMNHRQWTDEFYLASLVGVNGRIGKDDEEKVSGTNDTGISLSCCGVTVSVRIAWACHELIVLLTTLEFSFFLSTWTIPNDQF
jgi:hypothetical protein